MNSVLSFFAAPLIAIQLFMLDSSPEKTCDKADLVVVEIIQPDYNRKIDGTTFEVVFQNKGKSKSSRTPVKAFDLVISLDEAKKSIKDKEKLELISENNSRAEYRTNDKYSDIATNKYGYDFYWEVSETLKALEPKEKATLKFTLKNYWIYDSNYEIRVIIDPDNEVEECNEENNQLDFLGLG
jgi:hypothetical protein